MINRRTGKGGTVGVIDSDIDANHPDLIKNYNGGLNFGELIHFSKDFISSKITFIISPI